MKRFCFSLFLLASCQWMNAQFVLTGGKTLHLVADTTEAEVTKTALEIFQHDYRTVFSAPAQIVSRKGEVIVSTLGKDRLAEEAKADISSLKGQEQAFLLKVLNNGQLLVAGSDPHGTAYGLMELSRIMGVSPWEWWADVTPRKKKRLELPAGYTNHQAPSVEYRGIFINDEDWGLMPWSSLNYEPWNKPGRIGPKTNARIFELMLRLRANTYWPAMHECTLPFFLTEGNREVAKKYGIYIGGSHCEPMASSTAGEWSRRGKGDYDYVHNSNEVYRFWENRVKDVAGQEILYTVGMRGVHDGQMNGAKGVDEQRSVLQRVLTDQRSLLKEYVNKDVTKVPQVFIPYKEVLDIYNAGLEVPDDICLMWCDDNYGYIRHFPTAEERARKGGNGVYYHVSYWGRPHDHLWLGTFSPALVYQQMNLAYDKGIQKIWILNVGDIKPLEYQIELFLDMAWNIQKVRKEGVYGHLAGFLEREFGEKVGKELLPVMKEQYRLAYIRKPEFMGNTREEEWGKPEFRVVKDLPWTRQQIDQRLKDYQAISDKAEQIEAEIPADRKEAYFQLVKYPVQAATQMNKKMLYAQYARHGEMDWSKSDAAFDSIKALTMIYNEGLNHQGKWKYMMDYKPRNLPVFQPVKHTSVDTPILEEQPTIHTWNALDCSEGHPLPCEGLGYQEKAAEIEKDSSLSFDFDKKLSADSLEVEVRLLPNHPLIDGTPLRIAVSLDSSAPQIFAYQTKGRSEEWKENVLSNQAIRRAIFPVKGDGSKHRITIKALDQGVVLDQVVARTK